MVLNILLHPTLFWIPKNLPFLKLGETIFDPDFKIKKMSSFQAGLTNNWVEKLQQFRRVRQDNLKKWLSVLDTMSCKICLPEQSSIPDIIRLPVEIEDEQYRAAVLASEVKDGSGISIAYPDALCDVTELKEMFISEDFSAAKKHARELITLPIHPFVAGSDLIRIKTRLRKLSCAIIKDNQ